MTLGKARNCLFEPFNGGLTSIVLKHSRRQGRISAES